MGASASVALAGRPDLNAVQDDQETTAAHGLARKRENVFDERYPAREITTIVKKRRKRVRRHCDHEVVDRELAGWPNAIEPNRHALGCVPDQTRKRRPA
jgi:hypothetical protein